MNFDAYIYCFISRIEDDQAIAKADFIDQKKKFEEEELNI
jgi:hypothetical protein